MKYKVGFIGVGNMGGALLKTAVSTIGSNYVSFFDLSTEKVEEMIALTGANSVSVYDLVKNSKYIFLGVKPNVISDVLEQIKDVIDSQSIIVSMAAGVSINEISRLSNTKRIIRIMPNTPSSIGEGVILYCVGDDIVDSDVEGFLEIMKDAGVVDKINENVIDAAAALSGCGPAFVYMFIEALADGAVKCGLSRDKALLYAKQTVAGSALLSLKSDKHPGQLKDEVCSPGGTTIEGVMSLEKGAFRHSVSNAVIAAYKKTSKLMK